MTTRFYIWLCLLLVFAPIYPSSAEETLCYDYKIRAKPLAQIPTEIPEIEGSIVMRWPWFIDLEVGKVIEGESLEKVITALSVQHTNLRKKTFTFYLRRNHLDGLNLLRSSVPVGTHKCEISAEPMQAYLVPGETETLEEYRNRGVQLYSPEKSE